MSDRSGRGGCLVRMPSLRRRALSRSPRCRSRPRRTAAATCRPPGRPDGPAPRSAAGRGVLPTCRPGRARDGSVRARAAGRRGSERPVPTRRPGCSGAIACPWRRIHAPARWPGPWLSAERSGPLLEDRVVREHCRIVRALLPGTLDLPCTCSQNDPDTVVGCQQGGDGPTSVFGRSDDGRGTARPSPGRR